MSTSSTEHVETEEQAEEVSTEEEQPDVFPRSYVEQLRAENAELRVKGKSVDTIRDALRTAILKQACNGVLAEPVPWSDEYDGEDGMPDVEKIKEAAEALAADRPWLSKPHGDIGAGYRGEQSDTVDLASLLRSGA